MICWGASIYFGSPLLPFPSLSLPFSPVWPRATSPLTFALGKPRRTRVEYRGWVEGMILALEGALHHSWSVQAHLGRRGLRLRTRNMLLWISAEVRQSMEESKTWELLSTFPLVKTKKYYIFFITSHFYFKCTYGKDGSLSPRAHCSIACSALKIFNEIKCMFPFLTFLKVSKRKSRKKGKWEKKLWLKKMSGFLIILYMICLKVVLFFQIQWDSWAHTIFSFLSTIPSFDL